MIQVTLTFSTIAAAVKALSTVPEFDAALAQTTEALKKSDASAATPARSQPTARAVAGAAQEPSTGKQEPQKDTAADVGASSAADAVDYPTLQKAVLALHKLDPKAALPIAKELGADSFKLLKPEQWADALAKVLAATTARG
jgi:DNA replication initiation complex subunit (GINS family)